MNEQQKQIAREAVQKLVLEDPLNIRHENVLYAACDAVLAEQRPQMKADFPFALRIAESVLTKYKEDQPRWWRRMDGTPILNDIAVRMAESFMQALGHAFPTGYDFADMGEAQDTIDALEKENAELRASSQPAQASPRAEQTAAPSREWDCFHCGEHFTSVGAAADHFGATPSDQTACKIKVGEERGLVMSLRRAHKDREELWQILDDIDTVSDAAKSDDAGYRRAVERMHKKRFAIAESPDGHKLNWKRDLLWSESEKLITASPAQPPEGMVALSDVEKEIQETLDEMWPASEYGQKQFAERLRARLAQPQKEPTERVTIEKWIHNPSRWIVLCDGWNPGNYGGFTDKKDAERYAAGLIAELALKEQRNG